VCFEAHLLAIALVSVIKNGPLKVDLGSATLTDDR
jgi:hypothetical protein